MRVSPPFAHIRQRSLAWLAGALACGFAASGLAAPFHASSLHSRFSVQGEAEGTVSRLTGSIVVRPTGGDLRQHSSGARKGPRTVLQVSAALISDPGPDGFKVLALSRPARMDATFDESNSIPFPLEKFSIPTDGIPPDRLRKAWLAFKIDLASGVGESKKPGGHCWMHTPYFLFTKELTDFSGRPDPAGVSGP